MAFLATINVNSDFIILKKRILDSNKRGSNWAGLPLTQKRTREP